MNGKVSYTDDVGKPLFPTKLLEKRAAEEPTTIWAKVPVSRDSYEHGFRDITYGDLLNAVDGAAGWLKESSGANLNNPKETIAYFGEWDPRYSILLLAATKVGLRMVFPSPRYTLATLNKILLDELDVRVVLSANSGANLTVTEFVSVNKLHHAQLPSLAYFLDEKHPRIPYNKTYAEASQDILAIMHTSGSTRDPKPVFWTNAWAASFLRQNMIESPEGFWRLDQTQQGVRLISMMPALHCGNLYGNFFTSMASKSIAHFPLPAAPLHGETLLELLDHVKVDTAVLPPSVAEYLAADPARLEKISQNLTYIAYAGGSVTQAAGDALSKAVKFFCIYASTENGVFATLRPDGEWQRDRWRTVHFRPNSGMEMEKIGIDGYEVVVKRDPKLAADDPRLPPALHAFPGVDEWRTKDLFSQHPTEPDVWVYSSRTDDVIQFADGVRFNPIPYEDTVRSHPEVGVALVFGLQRPNAVILLEPAKADAGSDENRPGLIERVWPIIESANANSDGNCIVSKSTIIVTRSGEPLPRAYKGTVQRGKSRLLFDPEIQAMLVK